MLSTKNWLNALTHRGTALPGGVTRQQPDPAGVDWLEAEFECGGIGLQCVIVVVGIDELRVSQDRILVVTQPLPYLPPRQVTVLLAYLFHRGALQTRHFGRLATGVEDDVVVELGENALQVKIAARVDICEIGLGT